MWGGGGGELRSVHCGRPFHGWHHCFLVLRLLHVIGSLSAERKSERKNNLGEHGKHKEVNDSQSLKKESRRNGTQKNDKVKSRRD